MLLDVFLVGLGFGVFPTSSDPPKRFSSYSVSLSLSLALLLLLLLLLVVLLAAGPPPFFLLLLLPSRFLFLPPP